MEQPSSKQLYRRLLGYLRPYRGNFILALVALVVFGATDGVVPFLIKHILDDVFISKSRELLYLLPIILLVFALIRGLSDFGQEFLMAKISHSVIRDIRNELNDKLLRQSSEYFVKNSAAGILSRVTNDVLLAKGLLTDSLSALIRDSIRILALIGSALYLDPVLAAIAFIGFPLGIYPVYRFGKRMRRYSRRGQESIGILSARLQESLLGNRVVKLFSREKFEIDRFKEENSNLTNTLIKADASKALIGPVNELLAAMAISGVLLYGGLSVMGGVRTQGDFLAFLISVFLLYDPFKKLSRVHATIQQGLAGTERIFEVLDESISVVDPVSPSMLPKTYEIQFSSVSYTYPGKSTPAVNSIDLEVNAGETVAIVGLSGSGKSTLTDLLTRLIDPTSGVVKIGGTDIKNLKLSDLRSIVAVVGQHTFLFHDSIQQNIAYGRVGATESDVISALKFANAYDFVQRLPNGLHTTIGEGGFSLSGGERQRLSIARAILKSSPILILDEATASLDNKSESEVQAALDRLMVGRTTIVIAHRLSTIKDADRIVVMDHGSIVESGTYSELLNRKGQFERLHQLQFTSDI